MKIFIAFRFTGEDPKELSIALGSIKSRLEQSGHEVLCTLWDEWMLQENKYSPKQIMDYGLAYLDRADAILAYINSNEKSEGMLVELGYALAKGKPIILAIREDVWSKFAESVSRQIIRFSTQQNLIEKLDII